MLCACVSEYVYPGLQVSTHSLPSRYRWVLQLRHSWLWRPVQLRQLGWHGSHLWVSPLKKPKGHSCTQEPSVGTQHKLKLSGSMLKEHDRVNKDSIEKHIHLGTQNMRFTNHFKYQISNININKKLYVQYFYTLTHSAGSGSGSS